MKNEKENKSLESSGFPTMSVELLASYLDDVGIDADKKDLTELLARGLKSVNVDIAKSVKFGAGYLGSGCYGDDIALVNDILSEVNIYKENLIAIKRFTTELEEMNNEFNSYEEED